MVDISISRMSSKGQVVIPIELREDIREGEKLLLIRSGKQIIIKKVSEFNENFMEDLEFAKNTEKAFKRYEKGQFVSLKKDEFLEELKKW